METFEKLYDRVMNPSITARDIFGELAIEEVSKIYKQMAKRLHPDLNKNNRDKAHVAFQKLGKLYADAKKTAPGASATESESSEYPIYFESRKFEYSVEQKKFSGGIAGIFEGTYNLKNSGEVPPSEMIMKVSHKTKDNDLLKRESTFYTKVGGKLANLTPEQDFLRKFLPMFLETFQIKDGGENKRVNVFSKFPEYLNGWYDLNEVRRKYPKGVDTNVMSFIFNRTLQSLSIAHSIGFVHGAVTPNHIIIHPESHLGNVIDWTNSFDITEVGGNIAYADKKRYGGFLPDEVKDPKGKPNFSSDIFMAAACMVYILGGDPLTMEIPLRVEKPIVEFLNKCLQPRIRNRFKDANAAYEEFKKVLFSVFGKPKFVVFKMK